MKFLVGVLFCFVLLLAGNISRLERKIKMLERRTDAAEVVCKFRFTVVTETDKSKRDKAFDDAMKSNSEIWKP